VSSRKASRARIFLAAFGILPIIVAARSATIEQRMRQYISPDGSVRVKVFPVGKEEGFADYESRIKFQSDDGKISCTLDFSSEDSEHGYGVVKAAWTRDSQYFVFSLVSSGGHSPMHVPTQFLSLKDGTVRSLDDCFAAGVVASPNFKIIPPHTVRVQVADTDGRLADASVTLSSLPQLRTARESKLECTAGRVFKLGDEP